MTFKCKPKVFAPLKKMIRQTTLYVETESWPSLMHLSTNEPILTKHFEFFSMHHEKNIKALRSRDTFPKDFEDSICLAVQLSKVITTVLKVYK